MAISRIIPSSTLNTPFQASPATRAVAPIINGRSTRTSCRATRNGMSSADRPRVTRMLKILLPMTLPTAMSVLSVSAACRPTAICGALLPRATTVRPRNSGRVLSRAASTTAARTDSSAPMIISSRPPISSISVGSGRVDRARIQGTFESRVYENHCGLGTFGATHVRLHLA